MWEPGGSDMPSTGPCVNGPDAGRRPRRRWLMWLGRIIKAPVAIILLVTLDREALALGGALLIVSGVISAARARAHERDPERCRREELPGLARWNRRLARTWILCGIAVEAAAWLASWPVASVLGTATALVVWWCATFNAAATAEAEERHGVKGLTKLLIDSSWMKRARERAGRAHAVPGMKGLEQVDWDALPTPGYVTEATAGLIKAVVVAGVLSAGVAGAHGLDAVREPAVETVADGGGAAVNVVKGLFDDTGDVAPTTTIAGAPTMPTMPPPQTYAESCPRLPDPERIGHGLGPLFAHDGAVQAGCGEEAVVAGPTSAFVARGDCQGRLRSVAVSAPGHRPVLFYGAAARFAWDRAVEGTLTFAEVAHPAGGEVVLVGTTGGTYAFTRPVPSTTPGSGTPTRCELVNEVARPWAELAPAMVELWLQWVKRSGWTWPVPDEINGSLAVLLERGVGGEIVAQGACAQPDFCTLEGRRETGPMPPSLKFEGAPDHALADLGLG